MPKAAKTLFIVDRIEKVRPRAGLFELAFVSGKKTIRLALSPNMAVRLHQRIESGLQDASVLPMTGSDS